MCKQFDSYRKGTWQLSSTTSYCSLSLQNPIHRPIYFHHLSTTPKSLFLLRRPSSSAAAEHEMVGLSVILENYRDLSEKRSPQILNKGAMIKPSSPTTPPPLSTFSLACGFLDYCFLCKRKLLPGKDIFMYKGDRAFCSVECRYRQIFMDEESCEKGGCTLEYTCSAAATSSTPPPPSAASSRGGGKGGRTRANAFAY